MLAAATVMGHLTDMRGELSKVVRTASGTRKLVLQLLEVIEQLALQCLQLQQQYLQLQQEYLPQPQPQQPDLYKFLAQWRDVIKGFRVRVFREVSKEYEVWTWSDLAEYLKDEEKLPEAKQVMTAAVKAVLPGMGLNWEDWGRLKEVADMSNTLMRGGQPTGKLLSPEQVDCMVMPQHLEHTRGALRKLVQFMSVPARPRKVC